MRPVVHGGVVLGRGTGIAGSNARSAVFSGSASLIITNFIVGAPYSDPSTFVIVLSIVITNLDTGGKGSSDITAVSTNDGHYGFIGYANTTFETGRGTVVVTLSSHPGAELRITACGSAAPGAGVSGCSFLDLSACVEPDVLSSNSLRCCRSHEADQSRMASRLHLQARATQGHRFGWWYTSGAASGGYQPSYAAPASLARDDRASSVAGSAR